MNVDPLSKSFFFLLHKKKKKTDLILLDKITFFFLTLHKIDLILFNKNLIISFT